MVPDKVDRVQPPPHSGQRAIHEPLRRWEPMRGKGNLLPDAVLHPLLLKPIFLVKSEGGGRRDRFRRHAVREMAADVFRTGGGLIAQAPKRLDLASLHRLT